MASRKINVKNADEFSWNAEQTEDAKEHAEEAVENVREETEEFVEEVREWTDYLKYHNVLIPWLCTCN